MKVMNNRRGPIQIVLFDLGGVLASDVVEGILFDRKYGLAPAGWLTRRRWRAAATVAWNYSAIRKSSTEAEFWQHFSERLGTTVTLAQARAIMPHVMHVNQEAAKVIADLSAAGIRVGMVSDNTPFWYQEQRALLGLVDTVDPSLTILSFEQGVTKRHGLYHHAALIADPSSTLVIEDRLPWRRFARRAGFHVGSYRFGSRGSSLRRVLQRHGLLFDT